MSATDRQAPCPWVRWGATGRGAGGPSVQSRGKVIGYAVDATMPELPSVVLGRLDAAMKAGRGEERLVVQEPLPGTRIYATPSAVTHVRVEAVGAAARVRSVSWYQAGDGAVTARPPLAEQLAQDELAKTEARRMADALGVDTSTFGGPVTARTRGQRTTAVLAVIIAAMVVLPTLLFTVVISAMLDQLALLLTGGSRQLLVVAAVGALIVRRSRRRRSGGPSTGT